MPGRFGPVPAKLDIRKDTKMRKFTAPLALSLAALTVVCLFADSAEAGLRKRRRNKDCDTCSAPVAAPACNTCTSGVPMAMPVAYAPAPCGGCPTQMVAGVPGGYPVVMSSQSFYHPNGVLPASGYIPAGNVPAILPANATEVRVRLTDTATEPANVTVAPGTTVRFLNDGKANHVVKCAKGEWTSKEIAPGEEFTATFTKTGTFEYFAGTATDVKEMRGVITVK